MIPSTSPKHSQHELPCKEVSGHTNFIDLEFIYPNQDDPRSKSQSPHKESISLRIRSCRNIIRDHRIKPYVGMNDNGGPKESIQDGAAGSGHKGGDDKGD